MEIKPIKTKKDYLSVLEEIEAIFEATPDTPDGDRLDVLTTLVEAYEENHFKIPKPNPIDAIFYYIESRGLSRKDLEPCIGSSARVSEILNRKRSLSIEMIRKLNKYIGIPADILIKSYKLEKAA